MSVLEADHVSIRYLTGDFKEIGLKEYVMRKLKGNYHVHEFWADRDVTFSLEKGDMLGIIGVNGAGKSTLLKAISGIMEPSKGHVRREGNVAALLELASGFDGELTVRENTYLRGAMLGYTRRFMDEKYDEIIDFAELRDFQDRPFRQLSSGMKSRLAFAIASLVQPDLLILDEVLSVGDGAFQQKSAAKMREIIQGGATTILVSHSIDQVEELCNKVLWLHKGEQVAFGDTEELCGLYRRFLGGEITMEEVKALLPAQTVKKRPAAAETTTQQQGVRKEPIMKLITAPRRDYWREIYTDIFDGTIFRSTVLFTIIFGFFVHFFILSNYMLNHDSMTLYYTGSDWLLTQGKWFNIFSKYHGPILLNYIGGAVGIVAAGLLAGVLTLIFSIRSKPAGWLMGAVVVAFPSVAAMFMYRACDGFEFTALLAVLAAYFARKNDWLSILIGIALLTLSLGKYQGYLGFTASILVLLCILELLRQSGDYKKVFSQGVRYIVQLLISVGLYYIILQIRLKMTGTRLSSYKGIDNMVGNLNPVRLCRSAVGAMKSVCGFFLKDNLGQPSRAVAAVYTLTVVAVLALVVWTVMRRKLYREPVRLAMLFALLLIVYPLAVNIIGVLSANQSYYYITIYPFVMFFICVPVLLQECLPEEVSRGEWWMRTASLLLVMTCVWGWLIRDNQAYQKLFHGNQNLRTKTTALVAQIQNTPGYTVETPVMMIGSAPFPYLTSSGVSRSFDNINTSAMGLRHSEGEIYNTGILHAYIVNNISPYMTFGNKEELSDAARAVVDEMPVYPNSGSIQLVDGCILVKLGT